MNISTKVIIVWIASIAIVAFFTGIFTNMDYSYKRGFSDGYQDRISYEHGK